MLRAGAGAVKSDTAAPGPRAPYDAPYRMTYTMLASKHSTA